MTSTSDIPVEDAHAVESGRPQAGDPAPLFRLESGRHGTIALSDYLGRPVILAYYPGDWTPVCGDQMALYNEVVGEFERHDAALLGISVDSRWSHAAFAEARNLRFPLLADFEPKGAVARRYGVYRAAEGTSERALFVIDGAGRVAWRHVSPPEVNPGADGILEALEHLSRR
jgi:peroxiredoxin